MCVPRRARGLCAVGRCTRTTTLSLSLSPSVIHPVPDPGPKRNPHSRLTPSAATKGSTTEHCVMGQITCVGVWVCGCVGLGRGVGVSGCGGVKMPVRACSVGACGRAPHTPNRTQPQDVPIDTSTSTASDCPKHPRRTTAEF